MRHEAITQCECIKPKESNSMKKSPIFLHILKEYIPTIIIAALIAFIIRATIVEHIWTSSVGLPHAVLQSVNPHESQSV